MQAVLLAGGKGTRLGTLSLKLPKSLIKIGGKPILEHQLLLLKRYGIRDIWILSGYLGKMIKDYFGDGKKWQVNIHHLIESKPLGTAGAVKTLEGKIKGDFLVLSGDVICDFDIKTFIKFHKNHKDLAATIIVHPSDHPFDSDLVEVSKIDKVTRFLVRKNKIHSQALLFRNLTNASIFILRPKIFKFIKKDKKSDLEEDIFPNILKSGDKLYAYKTAEYLKDVGTSERLRTVTADFLSGKVSRLNKRNKRAAIFMDRDGVINHEVDQLKRISDFRMFPFAGEAIRKINSSDYLAIIITNQPMVAKGFLTENELDQIHKKLETDLGLDGAKLDAIYWCPHYPKKGFAGEVSKLKIKCNCRKPKIGLIKRAVKDFNIDLTSSFFIGDSTVDAKTAHNAKIKFVGVKTDYALKDGRYPLGDKFRMVKNLLEAVDLILPKT